MAKRSINNTGVFLAGATAILLMCVMIETTPWILDIFTTPVLFTPWVVLLAFLCRNSYNTVAPSNTPMPSTAAKHHKPLRGIAIAGAIFLVLVAIVHLSSCLRIQYLIIQ